MQLTYVSRPWVTQAFLKVVRFAFGIFAAAGAYQLYQMTQEFGKGKSGSGMSLLSLLAVVVIAGGISATSSFLLTEAEASVLLRKACDSRRSNGCRTCRKNLSSRRRST